MVKSIKTKRKNKEGKVYKRESISFVLYIIVTFSLLVFLGTLANIFYESSVTRKEKNEALERELIEVKQKLNSITTSSPTPTAIKQQTATQNPQQVQQQVQQAKEPEKVVFNTKQLKNNGTYYCYAETLESLNNLESNTKTLRTNYNNCEYFRNSTFDNCTGLCSPDCYGKGTDCYESCSDACYKEDDKDKKECEEKEEELNEYLEYYIEKLKEFCP